MKNTKRIVMDFGRTIATPGALAALESAGVSAVSLLDRHTRGDWGDVCPEDAALNNDALVDGSRILSSYEYGTEKFWVITEADRSVTTVLLPSEY